MLTLSSKYVTLCTLTRNDCFQALLGKKKKKLITAFTTCFVTISYVA